jgi:3-methyladenine DNA glycosylase Tag
MITWIQGLFLKIAKIIILSVHFEYIMKKKIYKPKNDDEFLEHASKIIFVAGFRYSLVEERWPLIRKAFNNLSIKKLSKFTDKDIDKMMKSKGMIRNIGKIKAIVENSKKCKEIQKDYGSVLKWIDELKRSYKKDPLLNASLEESFRKFNRIGKITSGWLASLHNAKGKCLIYEM